MADPEQVSIREFARRLGVSDTAVRKWLKAIGIRPFLKREEGGAVSIIDFEAAKTAWVGTRKVANPVRTGSQSGSQGREPDARPAIVTPTVHTVPAGDASGEPTQGELIPPDTLIEAQLKLTKERLRKLQMENDVSSGRLVPVEVAAKEAFEAERTIRESILNLPARLSGELAAETDPGKIFTRLDAALRECLSNTAAELLATVNA